MTIRMASPLYIVRQDCEKDLFAVLRRLAEVGFDGIARPDHVPTMVGETAQEASYGLQGNLFAVGYIKGLMEAVQKTRA